MLTSRLNSRRSFLHLGGLLPLGMGLVPWLSRGDAIAATTSKAAAKSCILLWLDGGPSHLEMWDPKTDSPSEVRGPFGSIATSIPGVHFSENLRQLSSLAHRMTIIRSMTSPLGEHGLANNYMLTGYQPSPCLNIRASVRLSRSSGNPTVSQCLRTSAFLSNASEWDQAF